MTDKEFDFYLQQPADGKYYNLNSLAYYFEDMAKKEILIKELAKRIVEYDAKQNLQLTDIEQQVSAELSKWDQKTTELPETVNELMQAWVDDGTLSHVIDTTLIDEKVAPLTAQLAETLKKGGVSVSDIDKNKGKIDQSYLSDTLLQQMAGSTPVNAVPAKRSITNDFLADKSVTRGKTQFYKNISRNLFDKNEVIRGGHFSSVNGNFVLSDSFWSTGFIKVDPSKTYKSNNGGHVCFWDAAGTFISGVNSDTITSIPLNADTMTQSLSVTHLDIRMIVEGSTLPSVYESPVYIDESLQLDIGNAGAKFTEKLGEK